MPQKQKHRKPPHKGLRDLVHQIEMLVRNHPCNSQAWPAVSTLCDHLSAIAAVEELNRKLASAESKAGHAAVTAPATA